MLDKTRLIAIIALTGIIAACGGGGEDNNLGPVDPQTTVTITKNLSNYYTSSRISSAGATNTCLAQNGVGDDFVSCSIHGKVVAALHFANLALDNIRSIAATARIDNVAVTALLNQYKSSDLAWLNVNTFAPTMTLTAAQVETLLGPYASNINDAYGSVINQIN